MNRVLVDTSVLSLFLKFDTRADLYRKHLEGVTPGIAFMTIAEIYFWAERRRWGARRRAFVDKTLHGYVVIPCDDALCLSWAQLRYACERKGRPISVADAWVAACALRFDAPLVTHNRKDFEAIADLRIISENAWTAMENLGDDTPLRTSDFAYDLPPELIAQEPLAERDASRLLVLDRRTGATTHDIFRNLGVYLRPGDLLVMNDSRVRPARVWAVKSSGGRLELLILRPTADGAWEALVKPGRRAPVGTTFTLTDRAGQVGDMPVHGEVLAKEPDGVTRIRVDGPLDPALARLGEMPLPPYIHRRLPETDTDRYQTTYAATTGSAAAPTAGLHFTPALLDALRANGVRTATVTLHVGLDTFRPVTEEDPTAHLMHAEWYTASAGTAATIVETMHAGSRIVAVGTTSVRVLESVAAQPGGWAAATERGAEGWTRLFIRPGYTFRTVDALITNFHLPRSTLLMLVSAFAGREHILAAYAEAVRERYRFFSFGDACLIF